MVAENLDLGTCTLDAEQAAAAFCRSRSDPTKQWLKSEGVRRVVTGLQHQGLRVIIVAEDTGMRDPVCIMRNDPILNQCRIMHARCEGSQRPEMELLHAARENRCLYAVASDDASKFDDGSTRVTLADRDTWDWACNIQREAQVRYKFDEKGMLRVFLPDGVERYLARLRNGPILHVPFSLAGSDQTQRGGHLWAKHTSADYTRKAVIPSKPMSNLFNKVDDNDYIGHRAVSTPRTATPDPILARKISRSVGLQVSGASRRAPLPVSSFRPATVERSGCSATLSLSLHFDGLSQSRRRPHTTPS